ncbi:chymotrypsin-like serine proteinase, partial [Dreissena polymorpha]|uniref:chymotrypsin-like serine proteinase n=1 Tax=Dreissena polymorpha TaxID=45954 RepID=UPI002264B9E8
LVGNQLATTGENFDRQTCEISGWGHTVTGTQPNKQIPDQLQETDGVIMTNSECTSSWGTNYAASVHICIDNRNTGTCQGDSGGPTVCFRGSTPVLAGVTSWGVSGCGTTYPSVYARVSTYRSWLDTTMGI